MMRPDDRQLGMGAAITRRDFLNGVALAVGGLGAPTPVRAQAGGDGSYRGQTDAAANALHALREGDVLELPPFEAGGEHYDLVVVGAGISGLAAAFLYRQHAGPGKTVLIVDPLADIGGHALRNEFTSASGRRIIGYGGSEALDSPAMWSPAAHRLIRDIGIDIERFKEFYDQQWSKDRGLTQRAVFFAREPWGNDRLLRFGPEAKAADWVPQSPLNARAQADLIALIDTPRDVLPGHTRAQKRALLATITYDDFVTRLHGGDPQLAQYFHSRTCGWFGVGTDATSALDAWAGGLPGFAGLNLGTHTDPAMSPTGRQQMAGVDDYIYHFPDGNAGVARALLRALIPQALPGEGLESLVLADRDDTRLDVASTPVRIRLNSSVVRVRHDGPAGDAKAVDVSLVEADGRRRTVRARQVVLACWSRVIPHLCPELPKAQATALDDQHKVPLIYANVLLNNWRAFKHAGIDSFATPGHFFERVQLDMPVSIGRYRFADHPDDPIVLHLDTVVLDGPRGVPEREQCAAGRRLLQTMPFEVVERHIRSLLAGALTPHGFDARRDIEALTINRWAHGYAYEYMRPWDAYWPAGPLPITTARRGWGRIAIANSDAGAYAYVQGAIDQATRAVGELLPYARLPRYNARPGPADEKLGLR